MAPRAVPVGAPTRGLRFAQAPTGYKAQQALAAAMGPITAGLRRFEAEAEARAQAGTAPPELTSLAPLPRAKLRRMVFSASKSHWFSACELTIFVLTGGHCIQAHQSKGIFLGRAHYLMHECKRVLNGETAATGPCRAAGAEVVNIVTLGPAEIAPAGSGGELEAGSGAQELAGGVEAVEEAAGADVEADTLRTAIILAPPNFLRPPVNF